MDHPLSKLNDIPDNFAKIKSLFVTKSLWKEIIKLYSFLANLYLQAYKGWYIIMSNKLQFNWCLSLFISVNLYRNIFAAGDRNMGPNTLFKLAVYLIYLVLCTKVGLWSHLLSEKIQVIVVRHWLSRGISAFAEEQSRKHCFTLLTNSNNIVKHNFNNVMYWPNICD